MREVVERLVGRVPLANFDRVVGIYGNSQMLVIIPNSNVDLPSGQHAHAGYEFLIPSTTMAASMIDNEGLVGEKDCIIPINPGQLHGVSRVQTGVYFMSLAVDEYLVDEVARQVFGKTGVFFANRNAKLDFNLQMLIRLFVNESQNKQAGHRFVLEHLSRQITVYFLRTIENNIRQNIIVTESHSGQGQRKEINRAIEFLYANFHRDFSLNELAGAANLSLYHFTRTFKKVTGKTPYRYFLEIKTEKARELLESGKTTVTEACYMCGFSSPSHFSRVFKRMLGVSPSEYCRAVSGRDSSGLPPFN